MTDLTKLKELAELASKGAPGPWQVEQLSVTADTRAQVCCGRAYMECCGEPAIDGEEFYPVCSATGETLADFIAAANPQAILGLIAEVERLRGQVDHLINQHMPREPIPDMPGYSRVVDAERLVAENEVLRSALQAVQGEVDGNIRPLTRDLVNMVSGVKNGSHPNDIYDHCDEIDRIIDAALEGGGR